MIRISDRVLKDRWATSCRDGCLKHGGYRLSQSSSSNMKRVWLQIRCCWLLQVLWSGRNPCPSRSISRKVENHYYLSRRLSCSHLSWPGRFGSHGNSSLQMSISSFPGNHCNWPVATRICGALGGGHAGQCLLHVSPVPRSFLSPYSRSNEYNLAAEISSFYTSCR